MAIFVLSLLFFWAMWYASVTLTNVADWLFVRHGWLAAEKFGSGNLHEVSQAVATLVASRGLVNFLFLSVILAEAVAAVLFASSFLHTAIFGSPGRVTIAALVWSGMLWQAFLIADSVFRTYKYTPVHFAILCATMLTAMMVKNSHY